MVDPQGREQPRGVAGEILARGPVVMLGYLGQPEQTAACNMNVWFRTGDGPIWRKTGFCSLSTE